MSIEPGFVSSRQFDSSTRHSVEKGRHSNNTLWQYAADFFPLPSTHAERARRKREPVAGRLQWLAGSICRSQSANERAETRFCRLETNIYQSKNWWINWLSNRNQAIIHCRTSLNWTLTKVPNVDGIPHKTAVFYMNKGLCGPRVCHTHRTKTWEDNGNRIRWRMDIFHSK